MTSGIQSVRVQTSSRLHFGMLSLAEEESDSPTGRQFGGVGLMVRAPGVAVRVRRAAGWAARGPLAGRALEFARWACQALPAVGAIDVTVENAAPEHVGLGTGTQLGLAVAQAAAQLAGRADLDACRLAALVGRGQRSALGIHGFARGGFLVEAGKRPGGAVAPLIARMDFPDSWRILLILPRGRHGLHGPPEHEVFAQLQGKDAEHATQTLCRLTLLGMLPALAERDLAPFGEALYEFNRLVGELFRPWQGGAYGPGRTGEVVEFCRQRRIAGAGQSSWGPTAFAIVADDMAATLSAQLREYFDLSPEEVVITQADNQGAVMETSTETEA